MKFKDAIVALKVFRKHGAITTYRLYRITGISLTTAIKRTKELETYGLIYKLELPRKSVFKLTDKGEKLLEVMRL